MGAKLKELKKQSPKLGFGVAAMLGRLIPAFKTPTYACVQRVDGVMKTIAQLEQERGALITQVFEKYNIPKDEVIDAQHPLFYELAEQIDTKESSITQTQLQQFTLQQFNQAVDGAGFNYSERKLLEFWLVKLEQVKE
jgi:hypothetical protein